MTIIVTGGAGGIGGGVVRCYVREGATVAIVDINDEAGRTLEVQANELAAGGGSAKFWHLDVSKADEVFAGFDEIIADMGGVDVLAHLAAVDFIQLPPELWTVEQMHKFWENNLDATVLTNQAVYKHFKETKQGVIINYASDTGISGSPFQGPYAMSKAGVLAWTRTLAMTWARESNVRVNSVCPQIMTPMYEHYIASLDDQAREAFLSTWAQVYPLYGKPGDPDKDAGPVMVFLASEDSRYINGQIIAINGGAEITR